MQLRSFGLKWENALFRAVSIINAFKVEAEPEDRWYKRMVKNVQAQPRRYSKWRLEDGKLYKNTMGRPNFNGKEERWKVVVRKIRGRHINCHCDDIETAEQFGVKITVVNHSTLLLVKVTSGRSELHQEMCDLLSDETGAELRWALWETTARCRVLGWTSVWI